MSVSIIGVIGKSVTYILGMFSNTVLTLFIQTKQGFEKKIKSETVTEKSFKKFNRSLTDIRCNSSIMLINAKLYSFVTRLDLRDYLLSSTRAYFKRTLFANLTCYMKKKRADLENTQNANVKHE